MSRITFKDLASKLPGAYKYLEDTRTGSGKPIDILSCNKCGKLFKVFKGDALHQSTIFDVTAHAAACSGAKGTARPRKAKKSSRKTAV